MLGSIYSGKKGNVKKKKDFLLRTVSGAGESFLPWLWEGRFRLPLWITKVYFSGCVLS